MWVCVWTGKKRTNTTNREATNKSKEKVVGCVRGACARVCVCWKRVRRLLSRLSGAEERKKEAETEKKNEQMSARRARMLSIKRGVSFLVFLKGGTE